MAQRLGILQISPTSLTVGGAAIFARQQRNQSIAILGMWMRMPLLKRMFREWQILYASLAPENMAEEEIP